MTVTSRKQGAVLFMSIVVLAQSPHSCDHEFKGVFSHFNCRLRGGFPFPRQWNEGRTSSPQPGDPVSGTRPRLRENGTARYRAGQAEPRAFLQPRVGQSYTVERGQEYAARRVEEDAIRWFEVVAQVVMQGAIATPTIPASKIETFASTESVREWCARGVDRE
jgi:hypothetical protein